MTVSETVSSSSNGIMNAEAYNLPSRRHLSSSSPRTSPPPFAPSPFDAGKAAMATMAATAAVPEGDEQTTTDTTRAR